MLTAGKMQRILIQLATKYQFPLEQPTAHMRLINEPYMPLVIEKIGRHLISVAHYAHINGDACADPDLVLFTGYLQWVPVELSQILVYTKAAWVNDAGDQIVGYDPMHQIGITRFAEWWADNIRAQGWLTAATKEDPRRGYLVTGQGYQDKPAETCTVYVVSHEAARREAENLRLLGWHNLEIVPDTESITFPGGNS